ncbi:dTDP-4-dehydrorhamnose 3,5-epimerase [compost metagenome]
MHYQLPPHAEIKLVSCIRGAVWDVAVDVRQGSPTFLQWHAERLSADNGRALLIPEGFAHGFQTLTDDVDMLYCHSAPYAPQSEAGLHFQDARLGIAWPLPLTQVSERDQQHPRLDTAFPGVAL